MHINYREVATGPGDRNVFHWCDILLHYGDLKYSLADLCETFIDYVMITKLVA